MHRIHIKYGNKLIHSAKIVTIVCALVFVFVTVGMIFFYDMFPFKYYKKYRWDISENNDKSVEAVMVYTNGGYVINIFGKGEMIDFEGDNRIAWMRLKTMSTGWRYNLVEIHIEEGVTNVGKNAFCSQIYLNSVTLPKSLENIGDQAFRSCYDLESIKYQGSTADWKRIVFGNKWLQGSNIKYIECVDGILEVNN